MRKWNQYRSQVRDCVYKVDLFLRKLQEGVICLKDCGELELKHYVAEETGVGLTTVYTTLKEANNCLDNDEYASQNVEAASNADSTQTYDRPSSRLLKFESPRKKSKLKRSTVTNLDNFDLEAITRMIHNRQTRD